MPFKSEKQRKFLWANEPEIAKEWTRKYGNKPKGTKRKTPTDWKREKQKES